jgi:hypothetical protein
MRLTHFIVWLFSFFRRRRAGRARLFAALLGLGGVGLAPGLAGAQSLEWRFRSEHRNVVDVELYGQESGRVWPGGGDVYTLRDSSVRTIDVSCRRGERICYGAWVRNTRSSTWGAGPDGRQECRSCCFICDGGRTPVLVLE